MRISDWSSDVCSPDLGTTKLNAVINGQADLLLGYVMDQSMKIKDATGKNVYPIKFADYGIHLVSSGIIANKEIVKERTDMVRRFLAASTMAIEEASKHRSEEHASELQSLMRISYAVFCLKKKQQQIHEK